VDLEMNKLKDFKQAGTVKILTGFIIMLLSFTLANTAFGATSDTLVTNGGFETGSVSPWRMAISGSGNVATLAITSDAYSGNYAGKISVTSCNSPNPAGYIAFNSPMLTPIVGQTYTLTFTYKASSSFDAFFLCQTSTAQVYNIHVVCYASSVWKTVSFKVGPVPSAIQNWFTLRFNRLNTVTIDSISILPTNSNPTQTTTTTTPTTTTTTTPTPTTTASTAPISANNLADVPYDWGDYNLYGRVRFGADPQICHSDTAVLHNGHVSIRIDPPFASDPKKSREINTKWLSVKPGDHLVFKAWIKVDAIAGYNFNRYNPATWRGARIGISYYSGTKFLYDIAGPIGTIPNSAADTVANWVLWNTNGWALRTIDCVVPSTIRDPTTGVATVPVGIIGWFQVWGYPNNEPTTIGRGWIADAELYINP